MRAAEVLKGLWYVLLVGWGNSRIRWYLFPPRVNAEQVAEAVRKSAEGWVKVACGRDR